MDRRGRADVVIVGGGVAGLGTALMVTRRGAQVVVVEPDPDPVGETADADFDGWHRPGVPQARQSHAFLGLGTKVLRQEAPDVVEALHARGVAELPAGYGGRGRIDGVSTLMSRRLVFEATLRRAVVAEPGVRVLTGDRVTRLVAHASGGGPQVVSGVMTANGEEIHAPLVVDASGRRSPINDWVADHRGGPVPERLHRLGLQYYTRFYRLRDGVDYPTYERPIAARLSYLLAMAFASDNRTFSLTIACFVDDPYRKALAEPATFERVLSAIPMLRPWVEAGVPLTPVHPLAKIDNRWRRLVDDDGTPLVGGVVFVGDSSMYTNPTFGRGMSLAFEQGQRLASILESSTDPIGVTAALERWIAEQHREWFEVQVATDNRILEGFRAALRGEPPAQASGDGGGQLTLAMFLAARTDDFVARAATRFLNMLSRPSEIFADPELRVRLNTYIETNGVSMSDRDEPTRNKFETLVSADPGAAAS